SQRQHRNPSRRRCTKVRGALGSQVARFVVGGLVELAVLDAFDEGVPLGSGEVVGGTTAVLGVTQPASAVLCFGDLHALLGAAAVAARAPPKVGVRDRHLFLLTCLVPLCGSS